MATFTGQKWETLMSACSAQWGQESKGQLESGETFWVYKNLLEKKTNLHWHVTYLQKYATKGIIPFGLRIKLFPHFKNPSPTFKNNWEQTLTQCSQSLINLLNNEHKSELLDVDKELHDIHTKLLTFNTVEGFNIKEKQIGDNLSKISKQIITTKERKFIRDKRAFSENKAYLWPASQPVKTYKRNFHANANANVEIEHTNLDSSVSVSPSSRSSQSSRTFLQAKKRPKKHNSALETAKQQ